MQTEHKTDGCAICGKKGGDLTVRQTWIDRGGFGYVPPEARVHPHCDAEEQRRRKGRS